MLLFAAASFAHAVPPAPEGAPPPARPEAEADAPAEVEPEAPPAASSGSSPAAVVAIGDGLVAGWAGAGAGAEGASTSARSGSASEGMSAAAAGPAVPGGWVPVLADCLEERAPQRFSVVDRAVSAETLVSARQRITAVRELAPGFVVVTLGAQELTAGPVAPSELKQLRGELDDLVGDLVGKGRKAARPVVLLLSIVPANLAQTAAGRSPDEVAAGQSEIDLRIAAWNDALAQVAKGNDSVTHVNLLADWPRDPEVRARLTEGGWTLSDQGHARVAAAVCDAILAAAGRAGG